MKVGDYCRTKKGEIGKIIGYVDEPTDYYFNCYVTTLKTNFTDTYITEYDNNIKSSPNIIDLIEVGDYVNGYKVRDTNNVAGFVIVNTSSISENTIFSYNIKSIITREMFESMEYKVGD